MDNTKSEQLFGKLIDRLLDVEGGYSNNPNDLGGETNWGITAAVARAAGYRGDMRRLSRLSAVEIYKHTYWTKPQFDIVAEVGAPLTAAQLFDCGVNMGVGTAGKFLQRALNAMNRRGRDWPDLAVDGAVGPGTLGAVRKLLAVRGLGADKVLAQAVDCLQGARYIDIAEARPANEDFVYGWLSHRTGGVA